MNTLSFTKYALPFIWLWLTPLAHADNAPNHDVTPHLQQQESQPLQKPKAGKPPEEAILVCKNKSAGSPCQFGGPNGPQDSGYCESTPDQGYFACNPVRNND